MNSTPTPRHGRGAPAEPLAVIGLGCRLPGGGNTPEDFWRLLAEGGSSVTEVPPDRWDIAAYFDPDPDRAGKIYTRYGSFVPNVDHFDAGFFGIAPREAASLDPQQRLLLEVSWEALENAGYPPLSAAPGRTGVFVGISTSDYMQLQIKRNDCTLLDGYGGTGNAFSVAAGRLSYYLGLRGPSIALDTACSSSLVSVHLAVQSLRAGECDMALAAGVNLILSPDTTITFSRARMMSADGRCKTFDASADGYVRGEGCGVVVLKRLDEALRDGDRVLAVIRGSAVNHDGRSNGLTAPSGGAQEEVLRAALAHGGVQPEEVDYLEAHGTGTALGDPIEMRALGRVYGPGRSPEHPLLVGSVKTNIGHLEAAAGVAGLIKTVLALQAGHLPAHLHLRQPNPHIPWDELPVRIPTAPTPWPATGRPRRAAVSSFGFGGTNAHVVLEEAPPVARAAPPRERPLHLLCLSARTPGALASLATRYAAHLERHPELEAGDVVFTANAGRSHFEHRLAVTGASTGQLGERLREAAGGGTGPGIVRGQTELRREVVFLFSGQGSQYVGMGRELYETQPLFRATLEQCDALLRDQLPRPLLSVLYPGGGEESPLEETQYTQPALFALEYALAQMWRSWGVEPAAVMGHSLGEYTAACVAGVFTLEEGLRLVVERARRMQAMPRTGAMAAMYAGREVVEAL
ncbi:MAG TPA: type I polyketide synthase, partial [Longimicrobiaceae bacterium]|nr:type I polyketide synthase [Longimicrobiaceae bacterium]